MNTRSFVVLMCSFLWAGFVLAISFMEAWLKFQAPNVTLAIGLGIGKLVFSALNYVEWFLASLIMISVISSQKRIGEFPLKKISALIAILVMQTFWILPLLSQRADAFIARTPPAASSVHILYVLLEVVKVALLFAVGLSFKTHGTRKGTDCQE